MAVIREVHAACWYVQLDLSDQILYLGIPEVTRGGSGSTDEPLPTLPLREIGTVSAAMLLLKAKQFDDGLYAAVDLAAQRGLGRFPGKAVLLRSVAATLARNPAGSHPVAAARIHAACELGNVGTTTPTCWQDAVWQDLERFRQNEPQSKPMGFSTWNSELTAIFQQDRLLQQPLPPDSTDALARALDQTPGAWDNYNACLRLAERLTNPHEGDHFPSSSSLRGAGDRPAFFPASRSQEIQLFQKLFGNNQVIPEGFDLMSEFIRRIRSGDVRLEPTEQSGWYDYQTWSLEPLVLPDGMPEAKRLQIDNRYRRHLEELFKGALALTRETHVKALGGGRGGYGGPPRPTIWISPDLSIEPLVNHYHRRAVSYRFVRGVLEEAFGPGALAEMQRMTATGSRPLNLSDELGGMESLFAGAALTACRELGMDSTGAGASLAYSQQTASHFRQWAGSLDKDADLAADVRMMVPVFDDVGRRKIKVWAFLGWQRNTVHVSYVKPPKVVGQPRFDRTADQPTPPPRPRVEFSSNTCELATPVMVEVYVSRLLNRDEFRRHCDRYRTRSAILANLA